MPSQSSDRLGRAVPSARAVGRTEAATHLLVAREALRNAEVVLHGTVPDQDDPMWEWASQAQALRGQVDELRLVVHAGIWKG